MTPASKSILPGHFEAMGLSVPKSDYDLTTAIMKRREIHAAVARKLDAIAACLQLDERAPHSTP